MFLRIFEAMWALHIVWPSKTDSLDGDKMTPAWKLKLPFSERQNCFNDEIGNLCIAYGRLRNTTLWERDIKRSSMYNPIFQSNHIVKYDFTQPGDVLSVINRLEYDYN